MLGYRLLKLRINVGELNKPTREQHKHILNVLFKVIRNKINSYLLIIYSYLLPWFQWTEISSWWHYNEDISKAFFVFKYNCDYQDM